MAMASSTLSKPLHRFWLPPCSPSTTISPGNGVIICDPFTDPSKQNSSEPKEKPKIPKIRLKQHRPSVVAEGNGRSEPTISKESSSLNKIPKISLKPRPSVVVEENGRSELTISKESRSLHVIETKPNDDQNNTVPQPMKIVAAANKKKRCLLSREEIEEDIAAIEALAGLKRLRRPKKLTWNVDQRQLDHLFPGLGFFKV